MRVLMTTDAVGGVWQYSLALARGLVEQRNCRVALVCLGDPPQEDFAEAVPGDGVELEVLRLKLEWMPDSSQEVKRSLEAVERLVDRWRPDLIHSNQFCFGLLGTSVPRVVVAHSDVLSWMAWHRGWEEARRAGELDSTLNGYRELVVAGLAGASAIVCPSRSMARSLQQIYGYPSRVIHNGLWPELYPERPKREIAMIAGRLWDEAKGVATAVEAVEGLPLELHLVGPTVGPSGEATFLPSGPNVRYLGGRRWQETRSALAEGRFYLATSSFEPFGLAALEAAFCGCALIAGDTAAYRELWGDTALYYRSKDAADLRLKLAGLLQTPEEAERLGQAARRRALNSYTADRMAAHYYDLYQSLS